MATQPRKDGLVWAADMAREVGVTPKRFRDKLRKCAKECFPDHIHDGDWAYSRPSNQLSHMERILKSLEK